MLEQNGTPNCRLSGVRFGYSSYLLDPLKISQWSQGALREKEKKKTELELMLAVYLLLKQIIFTSHFFKLNTEYCRRSSSSSCVEDTDQSRACNVPLLVTIRISPDKQHAEAFCHKKKRKKNPNEMAR